MKTIVVTGSTRGIGKGMAEAFLERGCNVVISGRKQESVDDVVAALGQKFPVDRVAGLACDVGVYEQVQSLWDFAREHFGQVDIWVNNAAVGNPSKVLWQQDPEQISTIVQANLAGMMFCCKVAINGMLEQGHGHIYNMEGLGSGGRIQRGNVPYGSTKRAVRYLTRSLVQETKDLPVKVSTLSPGMVITDMLMDNVDPDREEQVKRFFNILADTTDTVTPWLAEKILQNDEAGARIAWLTNAKIWTRFLLAPFRKRDLFAEDG